MKTIELFAGIGGFRIAADALGMDTIWANDLCHKACVVYRDNFGADALHEGDVAEIVETIPPHDLLTGGFPCQPFSSAGKKKGIRDPRGTLFQSIVDILRKHRPRHFVLENVKRLLTMERGLHFATILSSLAELDYAIEWRLLNAMHFGLPQNRQRVFIIGTLDRKVSAPGERSVAFTRLASAKDLKALPERDFEDVHNPSRWTPIEKHGRRFPFWGVAAQGRFLGRDLADFSEKTKLIPVRSVLETKVSSDFDFTESTLRWIGDNCPVNRLVQGVEIISNQGGGARMGYTIFGTSGVAPTLTSTTSRHYERYRIGDRYRRLTNIEYARIQGFPDHHCAAISVYDQYALIGNAVPPPLAQWVIERLEAPTAGKSLPRTKRQTSQFERIGKRRA